MRHNPRRLLNCHRLSLLIDGRHKTSPNGHVKDESTRVGFRASGRFLEQLREVQQLLGLNTPSEAVYYLTQRGLEQLTTPLASQRALKEMMGKWSPTEALPLLQAMMGEGPPTLKAAEKTA